MRWSTRAMSQIFMRTDVKRPAVISLLRRHLQQQPAESSTTASSADGTASYETEQASQAILQVARETADDPVSAKVWVDDEAQDAFDFDRLRRS